MAKGTYLSSISPYVVELLREGIALNTTASMYNTANSGSKFEISGSPTEKAILLWAIEELKLDQEEAKRSHDILHSEVFSSERKQSWILAKRKVDNTMQMHCKGAAELILTMCTCFCDCSGNRKDLDHEQKMEFMQIIEGMAASSYRCIAFAHKTFSLEEFEGADKHEMLKDGLILTGIIGISNPCREGVKETMQNFQSAGVDIQMKTGDDMFNAKAIATECGLPTPERAVVIEGVDFRNYSEEERMEKADKICVMARASPSDKLLMVQCLKEKGHVVAVTGDNINDTAAMEVANVGLFMGINQCTEVAKESYHPSFTL